MANTYKDLFFDLDHTLWDYNKNSDSTLRNLYRDYIEKFSWTFSQEDFISSFKKVNHQLWSEHNNGRIGKVEIRSRRFPMVFKALGYNSNAFPESIGEEYIYQCPQMPHLVEGAIELLEYCQPKYRLHLITNGFDDVQHIKIERSGIKDFFEFVFTSDSLGTQKPSSLFFEKAIELSRADPEHSLVIGDNPESDILGAVNFGVDCIFFNPESIENPYSATFEVQKLSQIKDIL